jgi:CHAT domain-containing protein
MTHLGHTSTPPAGQPRPRVWWCPSGPLAFLPLHAAGLHSKHDGTDAVLDRVVSSTIPTVGALQDAQKRATTPTSDDDRVLVAAMPTTPGLPKSPLPGVVAETARITALLPGQVDVVGLPDTPAATHDSVTAALPAHRWVHFACHANTYLNDPSKSALLLTDHRTRPLTVTDLSNLRLDRADLAVLSACSTALTGTRLPDEPIHLSAACQLAGYRHVIATLWPLDDEIAADTTGIIYHHLTTTTPDGSAALDAERAALATHRATRGLRYQLRDQPSLWAMLTHTGP